MDAKATTPRLHTRLVLGLVLLGAATFALGFALVPLY